MQADTASSPEHPPLLTLLPAQTLNYSDSSLEWTNSLSEEETSSSQSWRSSWLHKLELNISGDVPAPRVALWGAPTSAAGTDTNMLVLPFPWGPHSCFSQRKDPCWKWALRAFDSFPKSTVVLSSSCKSRWHALSLSPGGEAGAAFKAGRDQHWKQNQNCLQWDGQPPDTDTNRTQNELLQMIVQLWKEDRSYSYSICTMAAQSWVGISRIHNKCIFSYSLKWNLISYVSAITFLRRKRIYR